jgi:hypothetical protein
LGRQSQPWEQPVSESIGEVIPLKDLSKQISGQLKSWARKFSTDLQLTNFLKYM